MTFRPLLSLALLALFVTGCYYDNEELLYPQVSGLCDTTAVTYGGSIQPMLSRNCYACHSNANAPGFGDNIRLELYSDVKANLQRVYGAITWHSGFSRMPKNAAKLDDCSIRMFELWMQNDAPNDFVASGGGLQ